MCGIPHQLRLRMITVGPWQWYAAASLRNAFALPPLPFNVINADRKSPMTNQADIFVFVDAYLRSDSDCLPLQIQKHLAKVLVLMREKPNVYNVVKVFQERWHGPLNPTTSSSQATWRTSRNDTPNDQWQNANLTNSASSAVALITIAGFSKMYFLRKALLIFSLLIPSKAFSRLMKNRIQTM